MESCIVTIINIVLGILNILLLVRNTCIQKKQGQFASLVNIYTQIQNSINTLSVKLSNNDICIKGIFGLEILDKRIYEENRIDCSEIKILCSKLGEIGTNIELLCKTNFESSIEKNSKLVFYKLIEPNINQIISFYELITRENISVNSNINQMGGTDESDKSAIEYLQSEIKEQEEKLRMTKEKYTIK